MKAKADKMFRVLSEPDAMSSGLLFPFFFIFSVTPFFFVCVCVVWNAAASLVPFVRAISLTLER